MALLPRSLEIGFHPIIRGLSTSTPWIWYFRMLAKPRCRCQPPRPNSKLSYKVGNCHSSPLLQRETGPSFRAAAKIFTGLPLVRRGLKWHPFKVLQGVSHRRRRGSPFLVRLVKYWNKLPDSVVTVPSVNQIVLAEAFTISLIDWTLPTPSQLHATH